MILYAEAFTHKFLVSGHTYGPTDRHFAIIEQHAARVETVFTPEEWQQRVSESFVNKECKFHVVNMQQSSFYNFRECLSWRYTERTQDKDKNPLNFHSAVWFNFGLGEKIVNGEMKEIVHQNEVWVRHSYNAAEEPKCVSYYKKRRCRKEEHSTLGCLYHEYPLPIKSAKAQDVKQLARRYLPSHLQTFYLNIPTIDNDD